MPEDPAQSDATRTVADLQAGQTARIVRVGGSALANRRLQEMGVTRNTCLTVVRTAPLGDPVEVLIRGYNLSLRKEEARGVQVEGIE